METIIFIGLGNHGKGFTWTRHNIGKDFLTWKLNEENHTLHIEDNYDYFMDTKNNVAVYYVIPKTSMNISGEIIQKGILQKLYLSEKNVTTYIIHDDLQVEFGKYKSRTGNDRGPRGHNGNRSIIEHLKSKKNYIQPYYLSIGIGRPSDGDVSNWVLKKFSFGEQQTMQSLFLDINGMIDTIIK
jgi:PTH1 family peptidyl-tRNA hydrolase